MLGISNTCPYHTQRYGQVERMNRAIIEILVLNTTNPKDTSDLNFGIAIMAYCNAVQTLTEFTFYFFMYGRKMRLQSNIMYRSPNYKVLRLLTSRKLETRYKMLTVQHAKESSSSSKAKTNYDRRTQILATVLVIQSGFGVLF